MRGPANAIRADAFTGRHRHFPSPCKRSAAGSGQGEGHNKAIRPEPVRVTQASIPARRQISKTASALPLILTFSPAAKNAAKAKESVRGLRYARLATVAGSETRPTSPLPKIGF